MTRFQLLLERWGFLVLLCLSGFLAMAADSTAQPPANPGAKTTNSLETINLAEENYLKLLAEGLHAFGPVDFLSNGRKAKFQRGLEVGFRDVLPGTVIVVAHSELAGTGSSTQCFLRKASRIVTSRKR